MKILSSTIVVLMTTILFGTSVSATAAPPSDRDIEARKAQFMEKLEITDEQYDSVSNILDERIVAMMAVRDKYMSQGRNPDNRKFAREEIQEINENTKFRLSEVLTEDQMDKYETMVKKRKSEFKNSRKNHNGEALGNLSRVNRVL